MEKLELLRRVMDTEKRNLFSDLEICLDASPGPWAIDCGMYIVNGDDEAIGTFESLNDGLFIKTARTAWPHAILRALEAEAEIVRLKAQIEEMKDEIAAWKKIALGFDKFREGEE